MDEKETSMAVVIKDFNVPAPNGLIYDLSDESTISAIKKFCKKPVHISELGNPRVNDIKDAGDKVNRLSRVELDNAVAMISHMQFDEGQKVINGRVKILGSKMPDLLNELRGGNVTFGMRAFVKHTDVPVKHQIYNIITFDVIDAGKPKAT